ncbi:MAG: hypothetical protein JSS29_18750 [Proteobacteria bacterium]|nr:hypothetical protein [Pseudomonadota bacterium]
MRTHIVRWILVACVIGLVACSTSTIFVATWKAPDAQPVTPAGKKIATLVLIDDRNRRRDAEVYLANDLTNRGMQGVASYTLIGYDHPGLEYVRARLKAAGVDGVVVMRVLGKDQTTIVKPGGWSGSAYGSFGSYYSSYGMAVSYSTGYERTDRSRRLSTR